MNAKKIAIAFASLAMAGTSAANAAVTLDRTVYGSADGASAPVILSQPAVVAGTACNPCKTDRLDEIPVTLEQHAVIQKQEPACSTLGYRLFHPKRWAQLDLFGWGADMGGGRFLGFTKPYMATPVRAAACAPAAIAGTNVITQPAVLAGGLAQPAPYKISPEPMFDIGLMKHNFGFLYQVPAFQDMRLNKIQLKGQ